MRVVFCWPEISGYMAACWRALAALGADLRVIAFASPASANAPFDPAIMRGIEYVPLTPAERDDPARIAALVREHRPDAVAISGWFHPPYVRLYLDPSLASARMVMAMDTPWRGTLRQRLGRLRLRRIVSRLDGVVVAGERSWQLARHLGIDEPRLHRGVYGIDYRAFSPAYDERMRLPGGWPRSFLYVGRFEPVKGVDVLLEAYGRYRRTVGEADAWTLECCGRGSLVTQVQRTTGVKDLGFIQPAEQPAMFARHGILLMASRYEPWGVAIAEGCASGLPAICTEACSAAIDIVRSHYNGLMIGTDNVSGLAQALHWAHEQADALPQMGARSRELAAPYAAEFWALRWWHVLGSKA